MPLPRCTQFPGAQELWDDIPHHLHDGLERYLDDHIETGHFLRCVLSDSLRGALAQAAPGITIPDILSILWFLEQHAPRGSYGSPQNVSSWLAARMVGVTR